jgi:ASC-1-like (ASCH) protein
MDHIAIMNPQRKLIPRLLSGKKTIESRWYVHRRSPWNKIKIGDTVYFKDSGKPVNVSAMVSDVYQIEIKNKKHLEEIVRTYRTDISNEPYNEFIKKVNNKKYCILIFLKDVKTVRPFSINKKGYGAMSAWISVPDINTIQVK